ncbi:MAG: methylmalonyl Co-A mutase-associated GTPase MeaB [Halieaceae bacterium]|nr:methylmalonyl Co-A mutase-associated GTPase MeaB [Halieaceae bacterium]
MSQLADKAKGDKLVGEVLAGSIRTASRLISRAEACDSSITPILKQLFCKAGDPVLLGITGPPGAGKSTLVNQLIQHYRKHDKCVAVLAVDPSSPFSGGAILGDRVRMNQHAADPGVFIRSMASRGQLGGLAKATGDALSILQAMNFDVIILETVGVGQSEVEIVRHASSVLVLQMPGAGDGVQSVKAGILEIGDIYAVNKSDLPGADKLVTSLREMLQLSSKMHPWLPPVVAIQANTGAGIDRLVQHIGEHRDSIRSGGEVHASRARERVRYRVVEICRQLLNESVFSGAGVTDTQLSAIANHQQDPYTLAEKLVGVL